MSLMERTVAGARWAATARLFQQVLQFAVAAVLMRLLGPSVFGLLGMVIVFSGFAEVVAEMGFGSVIVQRKRLLEAHRSTAFWLCGAMGLALCGLLIAMAPLLAAFYGEPSLVSITQWIALGFVLVAPGIVPRAILQRRMRFDLLAKMDISGAFVSSACAVAAAFLGAGIWSLVIQRLVAAAWMSSVSAVAARWRPRQWVRRRAIRTMFGYGINLTGFNALNYWARSADNLLVGKFLGSGALGLYSRAYALMLLPLTQVVSILAQVMLPALSSIQSDKQRVKRAFLRALRVISSITFPMMLGLIVVAEPFVLTVFGERWSDMVILVQILAGVGMTQSLCNPTGWIYTSQGRTDWMFRWGLGASATIVCFICVGVAFGTVEAVAIAYLAANLVLTWPCLAIPGRLIGLRVGEVLATVAGPAVCAAGMALVVQVLDMFFVSDLPQALRLTVLVSAGVFCYAGLTLLLGKAVIKEALTLLGTIPLWKRGTRSESA